MTNQELQDFKDENTSEDTVKLESYIKLVGLEYADDWEEAYSGSYSSDVEFAQEMADELGEIDFQNQPWPQYCIDWEYAARDLMMDHSEQNGHYFRNL